MGTAQRTALSIGLGAWIGALMLFAVGVAPLAFSNFPPSDAAKIVGPILRGLNYYGVAAGLGLAALAVADRRGRTLVLLPLALACLCSFSELWVTAGIAAAKPNAFGPEVTAEGARQFSFLHQLSRALYFTVMAGTFALAGLHARFDTAAKRGNSRKD